MMSSIIFSILQLQTNFENAGPRANKTWMGRLHKAVRVIWPRFRMHTVPDLQLSGDPPRDPGVKLAKHFSSSAWHANWKNGKHLCSTIRRLPINKIVCCMSSWMTCVNVLWRKATRSSHGPLERHRYFGFLRW